MYAFISGTLEYVGLDGNVVVSNHGIGYNIFVSNNTLSKLGKVGDNVKLFTYTHVKEDAFMLYGFLHFDEKKMFEKLININGVGPKMAIMILSGVDSTTLAIAIANGDVSSLSKIKGVGKKTAERIILELKESVTKEDIAVLESGISLAPSDELNDAISALVSLGIMKADAYRAVKKASESVSGTNNLIKVALKSLDR